VVVTWFVVAAHVPSPSLWPWVIVVSAAVLPGTLLLVFIALPLAELDWRTLTLAALGLALVAFLCAEAEWRLPENFAKLWAALFAGWLFLKIFEEVALVVLVAVLIPIVDAVSVFTPGAPTNTIIKHHRAVYDNVAVSFYGPGGGGLQLGPPDILFYALFLGAAARFRLRVGWTWIAMTAFYALPLPIAVATHSTGLPALPFLSAGFLAANGDLLWRRLRPRH
jgi:hypothetical protein